MLFPVWSQQEQDGGDEMLLLIHTAGIIDKSLEQVCYSAKIRCSLAAGTAGARPVTPTVTRQTSPQLSVPVSKCFLLKVARTALRSSSVASNPNTTGDSTEEVL